MPVKQAVLVAVGLHGTRDELSSAIETAMLAAVAKAQADGVTDPAEIRARARAARARLVAPPAESKAARLERAMVAAIEAAQAKGVTDPAEIRAAIAAARAAHV